MISAKLNWKSCATRKTFTPQSVAGLSLKNRASSVITASTTFTTIRKAFRHGADPVC